MRVSETPSVSGKWRSPPQCCLRLGRDSLLSGTSTTGSNSTEKSWVGCVVLCCVVCKFKLSSTFHQSESIQ